MKPLLFPHEMLLHNEKENVLYALISLDSQILLFMALFISSLINGGEKTAAGSEDAAGKRETMEGGGMQKLILQRERFPEEEKSGE